MKVLACVAFAAVTARACAMPALAPTTTSSNAPDKVDHVLKLGVPVRAPSGTPWDQCFTNDWEPFDPPRGGVCGLAGGAEGYVRCEKKAEVGAAAAPCVYWCRKHFLHNV